MPKEFKVTVLISGRGSNLKALIDNANGYRIGTIISDNKEAPGLALGVQHGIETVICDRSEFKSAKESKRAIFYAVRDSNPDLVALAGFMQIVQPEFVEFFYGKLINIHPSLLPAFKGLHTHAQAIEAGASEHGCTVHYVDSEMDTGPIIAQAKVSVSSNETEDSLAAKVLVQEHQIYPWVVSQIAQKRIHLDGRVVLYDRNTVLEAAEKGFIIQ